MIKLVWTVGSFSFQIVLLSIMMRTRCVSSFTQVVKSNTPANSFWTASHPLATWTTSSSSLSPPLVVGGEGELRSMRSLNAFCNIRGGNGGFIRSLTRMKASNYKVNDELDISTPGPTSTDINLQLKPPLGSASDLDSSDLLVIPLYKEDVTTPEGYPSVLKELDSEFDGLLTDVLVADKFTGESSSTASFRVPSSASKKIKHVVLVGLGEKNKVGAKSFLPIGATAATSAKSTKAESVTILFPSVSSETKDVEGSEVVTAVLEEIFYNLYVKEIYKTGEAKPKDILLSSISIVPESSFVGANVLDQAKAYAAGVKLTRDLVQGPPNAVVPRTLVNVADKIAKSASDVMSLKVLDEKECEERGMNAYLSVGKGSVLRPEFIHLTYKPKTGDIKKKVAIVGKGLTFDSGGYNLKAGAGSMIELMKFDMGGSASTLGAAEIISQLQPEGVEVHFIIAACENMISDAAYHPGDVLIASNGKSIEVLNTDAEGRLTLADALVYADNLQCDTVVDIATLTGACIIGLGGTIGGLYSPQDSLITELLDASKTKNEGLWHMPLPTEYKEQIKSEIADLKNVGGREGGSITAALFLQEFINGTSSITGEKTRWAHLDIAGPVWNPKKGGATGFAAKLLAKWVVNQK